MPAKTKPASRTAKPVARKTSEASAARFEIPPGVDNVTVSVEGGDVQLTNLRKIFWPELKLTKRDLLQYYANVSPWLLPHLKNRAMVMKRYPNGIAGDFFFMKRAPSPRPPSIPLCSIEHGSGNTISFPVIQHLASLLRVINLGCIDLNPWGPSGTTNPSGMDSAVSLSGTAQAWLSSRNPENRSRGISYQTGERTGMLKIKTQRTADCVVGGFRYLENKHAVGSLLLGLYDKQGKLDHVGFTSSIRNEDRAALTKKLEKLVKPPGFTGKAPGGPSRWSTKKSSEWQPLDPKLVVEVQFDHFTGGRFRHGTRFLRWRPDKAVKNCTMEQVQRENQSALALL